jgi:predicted nucleotidyltransferase component of viral defense system
MLLEKHVSHFAQASQVDSLVAERDVVLTYVLKIMAGREKPLLSHLAFKGGTCIKKVYFGKTGRFSMDLDFTSVDIGPADFKSEMHSLFHQCEHHGISFAIEEEWSRGNSYGAMLGYSHAWNSGRFQIEVSFRERPILSVVELALLEELYFRYSEFRPFKVPCLQKEEVLAEKIRASFQRIRARDLYDLYLFATMPRSYDANKVRTLAVLKCWSSHDPFQPIRLFERISGERYDWSDLQRLVRQRALPSEKNLIRMVVKDYVYLNDLDPDLQRIVADSKAHREASLVKKLSSQL